MIQKLLKLMFVFCLVSMQSMQAQNTITGTITDSNTGIPLGGANVIEKGTANGVSTDFDGNYSITVSSSTATLVISYIGYTNQEIAVNNQSTINIALVEDASQLDEVVVTALGIKRERKSLGYSVQEIQGASISEAREPNMVNALSGKITGLQVIKSSNGPAGSSKIVLRGYSSLTGDNQPLIVVDGTPLDNFTGSSGEGFWSPTADLGNGLADINPDDIESLSVLKGASAAALYGSRAGNGVILITTKTGKSSKGLGVSYSVTTGFQSIFSVPDLQSSFGQGSVGVYDEYSQSSWGPKIEGQTETGPEQGSVVFDKAYDNIGNYYKNGFSQNHSLSLQNSSDAGSFYASANFLDDEGISPSATLERLNLTARGVSKFGNDKKWTADTKVQYNRTTANNRPRTGFGALSQYQTIINFPRSRDIEQYSAGVDEFGNQIWFDPNSNQINPYWANQRRLSSDSRDRFIINATLKHQFNDWLSAEIRGGADLYTTNTESKVFAGTSSTSSYGLGKNTFIEQNYSALIAAAKDNIFGKIGGSITLGGNLMSTERSSISSNSGELLVPNLFSLNNGVNPASVSQGFSNKKINSAYGLLQINYDGYLFLDITGRNDWSSALSEANRSFFYSSVNTSLVISDMITKNGGDLPSWFTFGKIRGSYAEVGNDLSPFSLYNAFTIGNDANGNTTAGTNSVLRNPDIVNELIKSVEVGLEARFLNNRIGLDVTWYKQNATNQIINLPLDPFSGFNSKLINAGDIQNTGVELTLKTRILDNPDGLSWDMDVNYSTNKNTIEELADDVTEYSLGGFDNFNIRADVGGDYGVIVGSKFRRVEDESSQFFGRILVDADGLPLASTDKHVLGSQQPDALLGITNMFTYKNFSFSFLFNASIGGEIFSGTNHALQRSGLAAVTALNGERADIVFNGVVDDGAGNLSENTTGATPQNYWAAITGRSGNLGINEANVYDATHVRLRNVNLTYTFDKAFIDRTPFQGLSVGVSANNVWLITEHLNGVDPEAVNATRSNATGFENLAPPTTRTVFLNIAAKF
ncbi:SusC/RagA family TonB-linked outer membrane protein [Jejuia spongiicola]|uniref:SusC/RagA family TonB-linked outer membrane protein n=1 Tax=Jejuia spongiicola TaxID=2942207 RepID=A0ABT0QD52_9FLAO|nr:MULTISPECIES: SusC/RagA family TonB-linked outer membrane protein [Flavobacteriaceae]MCL6293920.1 SusC/RagA family TonB-linked outer membrane protein [Jejuia spongiicola]PIA78549.1 SusC/RagA family protein [Gaetbulibacter sp. 4G1]